MKKSLIITAMSVLAVSFSMAACDGSASTSSTSSASSASTEAGAGSPITVSVKGTLDVDLPKDKLAGKEASISFSRFPATLAQFEQVLPKLKETPQGAVAAQLMAMELYRNNPAEGEKAFALCNVASNVPMIMSRVPDLLGHAGKGYGGDDYARPYQVASFLQGATPANGYNPRRPYTVKMKVSANGAIYSETYQAKVLYLQVATEGTDLGYRGCEVISTRKPGEPSGWIVFNCPGLYMSCRAVSFDAPFQGLK